MKQPNHSKPGLTNLPMREHDLDGRPVGLDADPCPTRVALVDAALTVAPDPRRPHVAVLHGLDAAAAAPSLAALAYLAVQRARVWRRAVVVTADPTLSVLLDMSPLPGGELWAAPLHRAAHHLWTACDADARALLAARFVDEAVAALTRRARAFADNAWCRAVREGRLAREQYVATLANTHQYVRYTPRLLARAIAVCDDEELRDHFTRHFRGEQKHERLIESDLRYLGADVDYVTRAMVPSAETMSFMVVQESAIAFYQDPARFLAAPFVAEGLAAGTEPDLLERLEGCIRRWGFAEPARATRFLKSHVRDDATQQRFLSTLHLAADAFHRSYDAYAVHYDMFE
jgi:pyrroloquinoline quinone (PQQ) biosynthesis protein C